MSKSNKINSPLICLKTGSKAKILNLFDKDNIQFAKISVDIKFENTSIQILRSLHVDDIQKHFNFS